MSQIDVTRSYEDGEVLLEADLDAIRSSVEDFVNVTKLSDDNVQANSLTASSKLVDLSVTTATIDDEAITSSKIASSAVTTAKIADSAITAAKIADGAITSAKFVNSTLTGAKFGSASVTVAKRGSLGQQTGSDVNNTSTSGSETDITDCSVSITTNGRPVYLTLTKTSTATGFGLQAGSDASTDSYITAYRDATAIGKFKLGAQESSGGGSNRAEFPANGIVVIDQPAAGTYTYKLTVTHASGTSVGTGVVNCKLMAFEIV